MESILQNWGRLFRALILFFLIGILIYFISNIFLENIYQEGDLSIETTEKGGFVFKMSKKNSKDTLKKFTQFLLPSNECWYDTGLDIEPGETCDIQVTGRVHLAIDKLVESVTQDTIPSIKWTDPEGNQWSEIGDNKDCQDAKRKLLIQPGNRIGNVIGYFYTKYDLKNDQFPYYFLQHRAEITDNIFQIGNRAQKTNGNKKSRLYLSVNDIMLDIMDSTNKKLSKIAYLNRSGKPADLAKWDKLIHRGDYYRLWFDDNVGGFLVNVRITK